MVSHAVMTALEQKTRAMDERVIVPTVGEIKFR